MNENRIFEELAQLRETLKTERDTSQTQFLALNELLRAHIDGQAARDATHREEMRTRDEEHKKELQLAEERGRLRLRS